MEGSSSCCVDTVSRSAYFVHHEGTKDTKGSDNLFSELRDLRVLRGENIFTVNPENPIKRKQTL